MKALFITWSPSKSLNKLGILKATKNASDLLLAPSR
jgi:hypothetical protein